MSGLTTTDFEVRDNGQLRPILSLRSDRQSPLSLAILVDMSGSMQMGAKIAMARQAYDSIVSQLHQGQDEVALFTFDASLHERQDFTHDLAKLRGALTDFHPVGMTSLFDATAAAARRLAARSATHKPSLCSPMASTRVINVSRHRLALDRRFDVDFNTAFATGPARPHGVAMK